MWNCSRRGDKGRACAIHRKVLRVVLKCFSIYHKTFLSSREIMTENPRNDQSDSSCCQYSMKSRCSFILVDVKLIKNRLAPQRDIGRCSHEFMTFFRNQKKISVPCDQLIGTVIYHLKRFPMFMCSNPSRMNKHESQMVFALLSLRTWEESASLSAILD